MAQPPNICEGGNYTTNSTYQSNLQLLLSSLSSSNSTYAADSKGASPHRAYGLVLCRGDVDPSSCPACYQDLSRNITKLCTYSKQAVVWVPYCMLRYSDMMFFSSVDTPQADVVLYNGNTASDPDTFSNMSRALFQRVMLQAAHNSSLLFATGLLTYSGSAIYGLAQCTRDLAGDMCGQCLQQLRDNYWSNGNLRTSIGARIYSKSCYYNYEVSPFYKGDPDITLTMPLMPPPSAPPVSTPMTREGPTLNEGGKHSTGKVIAIVVSIVIALAITFVVLYCFWKKRSAKNTPGRDKAQMEEILYVESLLFELSILKAATNNFSDSNKVGQGGFGTVYKGTLPDGQEIAVKRLSGTSRQGLGELKNELLLVARLQHKNLVRLRGVCLEDGEKLLVYEYVPNRSLDTFLFDPIKCKQLNWPRRFEIILGIARGLRYLHEESRLKVIHRDLKPSNVLLDAELNPKISDFGMARLFGIDETQNITSRVVGTFGYMAPEYARRGHFSVKMDAFSFGVMVLEIVTGRKSNSFRDSEHDQDLLSYDAQNNKYKVERSNDTTCYLVFSDQDLNSFYPGFYMYKGFTTIFFMQTWEHWSGNATLEIADPSMGESFSREEVLRCIQVGLLCVQDVPANRPLMSSIVIMLQSPNMIIPSPPQPVLSAVMISTTGISSSTGRSGFVSTDGSGSKSVAISANDVTISELHPR